ncbi:ribonuclease H-like domain-containing protein [Tanacetum coccineum]
MSGDDPKKGVSGSSDLNFTFGDPLYMHPNDTGGSPIVIIKLTGTENYKVWSIAMTFALRNHNKIGFIDGTCEKDNINPALANQWDMCNSVVFTWILNSLSSDVYAGAIYAKSAFELWNDLKDTYDKVDGSVVFNLHKSINSLNQNGAFLADYYNNLNSLWKQFDAIVNLLACTCEAAEHFEKHNQLIKLMQFLMGLDDNYLAIKSNILTREPLPLVNATFAIVSGEESHRNITSNSATKPTATIVGYLVGYVKRNFNPNSRPVTSNNTVVDPHSNNASSNSASNSPVSLSNEQLTRLMNLLNDNRVSIANANMSDFVVGNISLGWIVDSKANQHVSVSAKNLVNVVDISNLGHTVGHPNGLKANKTVGIGRQFNGLYMFDVDNAFLDALKTSLNLDSHSTSDHLCDTCNKAKQTREPFPLSDHKSNKIELSPNNQGDENSEATSMDGGEFIMDVEELPATLTKKVLVDRLDVAF